MADGQSYVEAVENAQVVIDETLADKLGYAA